MRIVHAFGQHIDLLPIVAISDLKSKTHSGVDGLYPDIITYDFRGDIVGVCNLVIQLRDAPVLLTARMRPRPDYSDAYHDWPRDSKVAYYSSDEHRAHLEKMQVQGREDWAAIQKDYARLIKQWKKVRLAWTPDVCMVESVD